MSPYPPRNSAPLLVGTPDGERNSCGELANASLAIGREEADHVACASGGVLDIDFGMHPEGVHGSVWEELGQRVSLHARWLGCAF